MKRDERVNGQAGVFRDTVTGLYGFVCDGPTVNGRRTQTKRRGFPNVKAAKRARDEERSKVHRGVAAAPSTLTVGRYLSEVWLPSRHDIRPSTVTGYRKTIRRIVPRIGTVKLTKLDTITVEALYVELLTSGGRNGAPLSAKTVANVHGLLSVALSDAVRLRLLAVNPASVARLPRRTHREMTAWTEDEATTFLAAVAAERSFPMWRLVLATGLRRGEVCGLRWRDVDLVAGTVTVATTRVVADTVVTGEPKTKAGSRIVALDRSTNTVLTSWRRRQLEERLRAGEAWQDTGLVFTDELGQPPHPETITRWWREAIARAGVRRIRLHDARHTAATVMLRAGVPVKVVSQRLGHADVAVTMRIYQHVTAQDDQLAADVLGRAFGGESVTTP